MCPSSAPVWVSLTPCFFSVYFPVSSFESSRSSSCPQLAYCTGHEKHLQVRISEPANIKAPWEQGRKVNSRFPPQTHWVRNTAICSLMSLLDESKACFPIKLTSSLKWRRQWHPTPVPLPGKSHGRRSLVGCRPWGHEVSDTTEQLHFHFSLSCIGERNGNPLQCSCLENPRDGGAWYAAVSGVAQSRTRLKQLSS